MCTKYKKLFNFHVPVCKLHISTRNDIKPHCRLATKLLICVRVLEMKSSMETTCFVTNTSASWLKYDTNRQVKLSNSINSRVSQFLLETLQSRISSQSEVTKIGPTSFIWTQLVIHLHYFSSNNIRGISSFRRTSAFGRIVLIRTTLPCVKSSQSEIRLLVALLIHGQHAKLTNKTLTETKLFGSSCLRPSAERIVLH